MKESLDFIYKQQKELSVIGGIGALLGWDQMTYMPPMGVGDRSEQTALISKMSHEKVISDKFWEHIQILSNSIDNLSEKDKIVVKRLKKDVEKSRKVPSEFVERSAKITTLAYQSWEKARAKNDFKVFAVDLEKIIELEKEYCGYVNFPGPRYDCLLDDYEEGMTTEKLRREFTYLKKGLVEILDKIKSSKAFEKQQEIKFKLDEEKQKFLCNLVIEKMKLPNDRSRLDVSTHPFTTGMGDDDVRITTSYNRPNPLFSFFSTIHEAGPALYELGMPKGEYKDTVISDSPSLGLHESQSRFWENMIGRSKEFWEYFYPIFKKTAPVKFKDIGFDKWYQIVNQVRPSLIRVEADELTYCLHVILRFEIETGLMDEKISVNELPQIWRQKMDEMLGVTPSNDVEGVLQDMHWSGGSIGYFPTYAIGTIYSAQIFRKISQDNKNLLSEIRNAEFENILGWLRKNIHQYGCLMDADDIIKKACGQGLNSEVFVDYLKEKYLDLYDV
jgi:carboxypeptidase Taq